MIPLGANERPTSRDFLYPVYAFVDEERDVRYSRTHFASTFTTLKQLTEAPPPKWRYDVAIYVRLGSEEYQKLDEARFSLYKTYRGWEQSSLFYFYAREGGDDRPTGCPTKNGSKVPWSLANISEHISILLLFGYFCGS